MAASPALASAPARDPLGAIREDIRSLASYAVAQGEGLIKLDLMENPYPLPLAVARDLGQRLGAVALNRYPPGDLQAFKQRLGAWAGLPPGSGLLLGNGSDELIHLLMVACARPGACVLSPWPSFSMYRLLAQHDRLEFVDVPLRADFALDRPALLDRIARHQPALIFLAYPNNPTGNCFAAADIDAVLDAAPGLVVIDEAYLPFAQHTWIGELPRRPRLLVLRTLSKLGLAGLRLGYLCAAPELLAQLDKVRPPFNVNVLTLAAVDFLLGHVTVLEEQAARVRAERDRVSAALRAVPGVAPVESVANFLLLRMADPAKVYAGLLRRGILVKDVSSGHALVRGCLRVTIGTPEENDAFLRALPACF